MNYSDAAGMCRVDFFKPSGKWYTTEAVDFNIAEIDYEKAHPAAALELALRKAGRLLRGMTAVCLDPYLGGSFPALITIDEEGNVR